MSLIRLATVPRLRFGASLALGSALVLSCGGSPTSAPGGGAANLPPQTNPGVVDKDKNKPGSTTDGPKHTLKGTVIDALTGEPVEKAMLFVEGVTSTMSSTPIPAAPSPGEHDEDNTSSGFLASVGGGGGPTRPLVLAQASPDNPVIPDAETTTSPRPSASGSAGTGASASPAAANPGGLVITPRPSGSPSGPAPSPATASSPSAAGTSPAPGASGSPGSSPVPSATPYPASAYKIDSRGRFELKDMPEGTYNLTFWAPGYQATTIVGALPTEVEVVLRPLDVDRKQLHQMKGVVRQANNQPASEAEVEISSVAGKLPGVHESTDSNGNFQMEGLYAGNYAVGAWTTNLEGEVTTFALVKEVPVSLGRERRSVSPTLVLRAVASPVLLAGTVLGSAKETDVKAAQAAKKPIPGVKPTSVRAYVQVGDGEIPIATVPVGKDGYFRMRLPQLPDGASYHVVASGQSDSGQTAYAHEFDVEASDPKMSFKLPDAPELVTVADRSKWPRFTWEPVGSDVSAYRVAIEKVGQDGDTIWEGWTTGTAMGLPKAKELGLLRDGESYRYSLAAVKLADDKKLELLTVGTRPWAASALTKPLTFEVVRMRPGQKMPSEAPVRPLPTPAPVRATPAPAASVRPSVRPSGSAPSLTPPSLTPPILATPMPSARPTPRNPRIKPMDGTP